MTDPSKNPADIYRLLGFINQEKLHEASGKHDPDLRRMLGYVSVLERVNRALRDLAAAEEPKAESSTSKSELLPEDWDDDDDEWSSDEYELSSDEDEWEEERSRAVNECYNYDVLNKRAADAAILAPTPEFRLPTIVEQELESDELDEGRVGCDDLNSDNTDSSYESDVSEDSQLELTDDDRSDEASSTSSQDDCENHCSSPIWSKAEVAHYIGLYSLRNRSTPQIAAGPSISYQDF